MNRQEKQLIIDTLKNDFAQSNGSFLIGVQGMTVSQIQNLRRDLRQQGGKLKVAKNTLMKIAAEDIPGVQKLAPYFKEQVGIVFVSQESPSVAKVLYTTAKENAQLKLVVGYVDEQVVDKNTIIMIASLPSKEVLMARICGALKAPASRMAYVMAQVSQQQ